MAVFTGILDPGWRSRLAREGREARKMLAQGMDGAESDAPVQKKGWCVGWRL